MVAVGHHNLGNLTRDLGDLDASAEHLGRALGAYAERDDRWSMAHLFEDIALWVLAGGTAETTPKRSSLIAAAERLRAEIGAPRFPATEAVLARGAGAGPRPARRRGARAGGGGGRASARLDVVLARARRLLER